MEHARGCAPEPDLVRPKRTLYNLTLRKKFHNEVIPTRSLADFQMILNLPGVPGTWCTWCRNSRSGLGLNGISSFSTQLLTFDISFSFNPGMKITEVASLIGSKWRDLDEEDKKPYEEQALKDKKRYEKEMEAYNQGTFAVR